MAIIGLTHTLPVCFWKIKSPASFSLPPSDMFSPFGIKCTSHNVPYALDSLELKVSPNLRRLTAATYSSGSLGSPFRRAPCLGFRDFLRICDQKRRQRMLYSRIAQIYNFVQKFETGFPFNSRSYGRESVFR